MDKPRIIVAVEGGVVQNVYASVPVDVEVMDWDNAEEDEAEEARCQRLGDECDKMEPVY